MRLIDADELLNQIKYKPIPNITSETWNELYERVLDEIDNAPKIDTEKRGDAISREWLLKKFNVREAHEITRFYYVASVIYHAPTIEPTRPHGEWIRTTHDIKGEHPQTACWYKCPVCNKDNPVNIMFKYCPNCGADMRGGAE